ncbi:MAG: hypothetical protein AAF542_16495 [Pseudomonadota bacterium]
MRNILIVSLALTLHFLQPLANASNLEADQGWLLLIIHADMELHEIEISGAESISIKRKDIPPGHSIHLRKVEAGEYTIRDVDITTFYRFTLTPDEWKFRVFPGAITYVGHFDVQSLSNDRARLELVNRSSVALEYMQREHLELLEQIPFKYGGPGEDMFLQELERLGYGSR